MVELTPWPDCRIHARNSTGRGGGCVNKDTAFPPSSNPLSLLQTNHTQNLRKGKFVYSTVVVVAAAAAASNRQTDRRKSAILTKRNDGLETELCRSSTWEVRLAAQSRPPRFPLLTLGRRL